MRKFIIEMKDETFEVIKKFLIESCEVDDDMTDEEYVKDLFYVEGEMYSDPLDEREMVKVTKVNE